MYIVCPSVFLFVCDHFLFLASAGETCALCNTCILFIITKEKNIASRYCFVDTVIPIAYGCANLLAMLVSYMHKTFWCESFPLVSL